MAVTPQRGKVRFIRRGGRVIPIHVEEGLKQYGKGVAVGVAGGALAGALAHAPQLARKYGKRILWEGVRRARQATGRAVFRDAGQMAFGHLGGAFRRAPGMANRLRFVKELRRFARFGPKLAPAAFLGAAALSGAYFTAGTQNLLKKKKASLKTALLTDAAGAVGFGVVGTSYLVARGVRPLSAAVLRSLSFIPQHIKRKDSIPRV